MGGSDPPFLYDPPTNRNSQITYAYSDFNPRAATQAHYAALAERAERQKRKAQQAGKPLVNFNQHPDSYMIVNNPTVSYEPMPASTKGRIIWARWIQFVLRIINELGALGVLICVICLKMNNDGPGWIIRVAPAWDTVITMYAIYHLIRPAKGRTPSSSASYHFFALFMDTGLIPFYVYIALYSNQNYNEEPGVDGRWTSFFNTNFATTTVIFATFIGSIVVGGIHLASITLDLYLIVMFRRIANLPPDMNPLEDNLTGSTRRSRSQKHKYKNSEASVESSSTAHDMAERKPGYLSGSTLGWDDSRLHTAKGPEARTIPFGQSRADLNDSYSPHNPNSARLSRQQYDQISLNQGPYSARSSRVDVTGGQRSHAGSLVGGAKHNNTSVMDFGEVPAIPAGAFAERASTRAATPAAAGRDRVEGAPTHARVKSQQQQGLLNDNWYVLDDDNASDLGMPRRADTAAAPPYASAAPLADSPSQQQDRHDSFMPQPLRMNPPTPPLAEDEFTYAPGHHAPHSSFAPLHQDDDGPYSPIETGIARALTVASQGTNSSSVYSDDVANAAAAAIFASTSTSAMGPAGRPHNGTPKGKYYGDLASATRGVRGTGSPAPMGGGYGVPTPQPSRTPSPQKRDGRVISRTGVDIADVNVYASEQQQQQLYGGGLRGRRDVSGKVVEEGRGGPWR